MELLLNDCGQIGKSLSRIIKGEDLVLLHDFISDPQGLEWEMRTLILFYVFLDIARVFVVFLTNVPSKCPLRCMSWPSHHLVKVPYNFVWCADLPRSVQIFCIISYRFAVKKIQVRQSTYGCHLKVYLTSIFIIFNYPLLRVLIV